MGNACLERVNADEWNCLLWDTEILVTACRKVQPNLLFIFSTEWENAQPLNLSKWDTLDKEVPWGQVWGHLKKKKKGLVIRDSAAVVTGVPLPRQALLDTQNTDVWWTNTQEMHWA